MLRSRSTLFVPTLLAVLVSLVGASRQSSAQTGGEKAADAEEPLAVADRFTNTRNVEPPHGRLVIHEWGTFTSLQDETGRAIAGINSDDEAVPSFVHRLKDQLILPPSELAPIYYKGIPGLHRDVLMRLETPVIYFYPAPGADDPFAVDVRVRFRGGWLTEYYPTATVDAPGMEENRFRFGRILPDTLGRLEWTDLKIGGDPSLPPTDARVWLAPRQTKSSPVTTSDGEAEQYLFYRGVGNLEAPLRVTRDGTQDRLTITESFAENLFNKHEDSRPTTTLWLVDIRDDGAVAFRSLGKHPLSGRSNEIVAETPAGFDEEDHSPDNLAKLRHAMHQALVEDGLYADEATALLSTWEHGYFKSVGTRLFFLLPQEWTDSVLPLEVSSPAEIRRTMVGRVELVTPRHRQLLDQIATADEPFDRSWFYDSIAGEKSSQQKRKAVWEGKLRLADAGITRPDYYQAYVELGRFRSALVLDEIARTNSAKLSAFAEAYHLSYFTPTDEN